MSNPTCYANPVIPGFFPDPSIVRVGGDYYLVNSTFQYFPGIVISHSRDLVHWKQIGHVFTKDEDLDLRHFYDGCGIWAPDISYHEGELYVFYCLVQLKKDRSVNVRGNYMVKSGSILGPWSRPVQLTEEGNDPSHFVDEDGAHYMLYAGGIPKGSATKIVRLNEACTKVAGEAQWIDYGIQVRAPEGPHLLKKDGYYYHTMAAGSGLYEGHHQLIARSKNVLGPYEAGPGNPFIAQMNPRARTHHQGHAKLVQTQGGEWWVVYLMQRRINGFSQLGRETGLDRVDWREDGWPVVNGGRGPSDRNEAPGLVQEEGGGLLSDDFEEARLDVRWQFVRNPVAGHFSLTDRAGWLRILTGGAGVEASWPQTMLLQREVLERFTATTRMEFSPLDAEEAGLVCYYDATCFITLGVRVGGRLVLEECRAGKRAMVAEIAGIRAGGIELCMEVAGLRRSFAFRQGGEEWTGVGTVADASFLSDQGTPQWGFTGTMAGVFAVHGGSGRALPAYFDWFKVKEGSARA